MATLSISAALLAFGNNTLASGTLISDTAFNLGANIDALLALVQQGLIAGISLTNGDTPTVRVTVAQASNDAAVLALVTTAHNLAQVITAAAAATTTAVAPGFHTIAVVDTAANVAANLPAIEALSTRNILGQVRLTDGSTPVISISAAMVAANILALSRINVPYTIALTDGGTPVITLPNWATGIADYTNVIARITSAYTLAIDGVVNPGLIPAIELGVNSFTNGIAAGTPLNPIAPLGVVNTSFLPSNLIYLNNVSPVSSTLPALEEAALAGKLKEIISYNIGQSNVVALSAADYAANAQALALLAPNILLAEVFTVAQILAQPTIDSHFSRVVLQDSVANILANLPALASALNGHPGYLAAVIPTSEMPYWVMTAAQFALAVPLLALSVNYNNLVVTLSDPGTPTVTLSSDVFSLGNVQQNGLPFVTNAYHVAVTGYVSATVANAIVASNTLKGLVTSVAVRDTASGIAANIAALNTLATSGVLTSIQIDGVGVPKLALPAGAATTDAAALALIASPYVLTTATATPVTTTVAEFLANIASYEAQAAAGTLGTVTFSDTTTPSFTISAATLSANFAAFAAIGGSASITLTDGGTPAVTLSPWQGFSSQPLLDIQGAFTFTLSGPATVSQASAIGGSALASHLGAPLVVSDYSYNLAYYLNTGTSLQNLASLGLLGSVSFLDNPYYYTNLSITQAAAASNAGVLSAITSPYQLALPATAAQALAATLPQDQYVQAAVSDTAGNIVANLDGLERLATGGKISSINVSDTTTLTLSAATVAADYDALALCYNVSTIHLTDSGTPAIHLQDWQITGTPTVLTKISGSFTWDITNPIRANRAVSLAGISPTLLAAMTPNALVIRDSIGNFSGDLAQINTLYQAGVINHIEFRGGAGGILALSPSKFATYGAMLRALVTTPHVTAQSVTVAALGTATLGAGFAGFYVTDPSANVLANLATLEAAVTAGTVLGVSASDTLPVFSLSAATLSTYADVFAVMGTSGYPYVLTDAGTPTVTITAGQLASSTLRNNVLDLIQGHWNLVVTGPVTAATMATVIEENNNVLAHLTGSLAVVDASYNVAQYLDQLESGLETGKISGITLVDGGTPTLTVQQYQSTSDTMALSGGILSAYTLNVVPNAPSCFVPGTRIMTPSGEVAVETLRAGDLVVTASGETAPVAWLGHRFLAVPAPHEQPIRIRADAFGLGLPVRDLELSPDHAVFIDGALIPVGELVDGHSIAAAPRAEVTYFHVMLPRHDILLACGLAVESFIEALDFDNFDNAPEAPAGLRGTLVPCAPRLRQGPKVEAVRRRLARAAGFA